MKFYRVFTYSLILWLIHHKIRFVQCTDTTPGLTGTGQSATSTPTSPTGGSDSSKSESDSKHIDLNIESYTDSTNFDYQRIGHKCIYRPKEGYSFKSVNSNQVTFCSSTSSGVIWETNNEGEYASEVEYDIANNRITIKSKQVKVFSKKNSGSCKCSCGWCCVLTLGLSLLCNKESTWEEEEIVSGKANTNTTGKTATSSTPDSGGTNQSSGNGTSSTDATNLKGTQASS